MSQWTLHPIRTEADDRTALAEAERLFNLPDEPSPDSPEGAYFDAPVTLIEAYALKHFPVHAPSPVEAIRFRMDQAGLKPIDLVPYIGPRGRVSEVLSGKRNLTLPMVRRLSAGLGIPAAALLGL